MWIRTRWILGLVALVTLGAFATGCAKQQAAPPPRPPVPVVVATVTQRTMPVEVTSVGNVEAISTVAIRAQVPGELREIHFKEGDFVTKGQVLFRIDARPYEAALVQAKAALARDKATGAYSRAQALRYKALFDQGVVPAQQVDSYTSAADASDAVVDADEAAIKTAELNLEDCTIKSPIDGRTGTIMVKPGNLVKVADVPMVVINQVNPIYVNFTVPQQYWPEIKEHMNLGGLRVVATIPRDSAPPLKGILTFVDNTVDTTTGSIHLRGSFENPRDRLWPGLYVNILLTLSEQPNATIVPAHSIVTTVQDSYVYVVKTNHTVERRTVVPSRTVDTDTVVEKGLQPGEIVVTDGQVNLVPGAKVEVKNSNAGPTNNGAGLSDRQAGAADPPTGKPAHPKTP